MENPDSHHTYPILPINILTDIQATSMNNQSPYVRAKARTTTAHDLVLLSPTFSNGLDDNIGNT